MPVALVFTQHPSDIEASAICATCKQTSDEAATNFGMSLRAFTLLSQVLKMCPMQAGCKGGRRVGGGAGGQCNSSAGGHQRAHVAGGGGGTPGADEALRSSGAAHDDVAQPACHASPPPGTCHALGCWCVFRVACKCCLPPPRGGGGASLLYVPRYGADFGPSPFQWIMPWVPRPGGGGGVVGVCTFVM